MWQKKIFFSKLETFKFLINSKLGNSLFSTRCNRFTNLVLYKVLSQFMRGIPLTFSLMSSLYSIPLKLKLSNIVLAKSPKFIAQSS